MNLEKVDDFLTVKELSKWIKLSESHIYFLVNKRKIPFAKLGGKLLFDKQKIKDWIDFNSPSPAETETPSETDLPNNLQEDFKQEVEDTLDNPIPTDIEIPQEEPKFEGQVGG
jgi:excisionase family DNA binding protein